MKEPSSTLRDRVLSVVRMSAADESVQLQRLPHKYCLFGFLSDALEDAMLELEGTDSDVASRLGFALVEWEDIRCFADLVFDAEEQASVAPREDYLVIYSELTDLLRQHANGLLKKYFLQGSISDLEFPLMTDEDRLKW